MGTADHRNLALAGDRNPAWTLPDPVDECETEAEAHAGLAQCNSLLTMGGAKPKKKKRPVLLLDPEEAANAYSEMALTAAQDFADPERAAARQPASGLTATNEVADPADPASAGDNAEDEGAARGPTPLSPLPADLRADPSADVAADDEPVSDSIAPAPVEPREERRDALPRKPRSNDSIDGAQTRQAKPGPIEPRPVEPAAAPQQQEPSLPAVEESAEPEPRSPQPRPVPARSSRFVEVPFEPEPAPEAEGTAAPRKAPAEPARNALRRNLHVRPIRSEPAVPSFAGLLARLRAAIERITGRR